MNELINFLFLITLSLSNLPPIELPSIVALSHEQLVYAMCSDEKDLKELSECREQYSHGVVSYFDKKTRSVLYDEALNIQDDSDNSFIVHEFVHALQYAAYGDSAFATCESALASEKQAYNVQQKYLNRAGQFQQVGRVLWTATCTEGSNDILLADDSTPFKPSNITYNTE